GQQGAGLLEQFADQGEFAGGVVGVDLAAGEGFEAAEEAQVVGAADQEQLVAAGFAGQDDAGGRHGAAHSLPSPGLSSSASPLRPRSTASSSRSMANGLRM